MNLSDCKTKKLIRWENKVGLYSVSTEYHKGYIIHRDGSLHCEFRPCYKDAELIFQRYIDYDKRRMVK